MTDHYVAQVRVGAEAAAQSHLERSGFSVLRPLVSVRHRVFSMFPGYLFVADGGLLDIAVVRRSWGVVALLGGARPRSVRPEVIAAIVARLDENGVMPLNCVGGLLADVLPGDPVRVVYGVMEGLVGVASYVGPESVVILLNGMLGASIRVRPDEVALSVGY